MKTKNPNQLQLIQIDTTWRLDKRTINTGKAGIAQARAALNNPIYPQGLYSTAA